jgi:hypothetical protein
MILEFSGVATFYLNTLYNEIMKITSVEVIMINNNIFLGKFIIIIFVTFNLLTFIISYFRKTRHYWSCELGIGIPISLIFPCPIHSMKYDVIFDVPEANWQTWIYNC